MAIFQQPCRANSQIFAQCPSLINDTIPLLIGLGFLGASLCIWFAKEQVLTKETFIFVSATLATGKLGALGSDLGSRLFYVFLAGLAPAIFLFHFTFFEKPLKRFGSTIFTLLTLLASIIATPFLFWSMEQLIQLGWFNNLRLLTRLTFLLSVFFSILFLILSYQSSSLPVPRRRIRLILLGTILAVAPVLLLSVLPDTLGASMFVPYVFTFPWLILLPLSYLYLLFQHRLTRAELVLNRAVVFYLLAISILAIYLLIISIVQSLTIEPERILLANAFVSVVLALLFTPFQKGAGHLTNWFWYGEKIYHAKLVGKLSRSLSLALDRETFRHLLVDEFCPALRLTKFALLLKGQDENFQLLDQIGLKLPQGVSPNFLVSSPFIKLLALSVKPLSRIEIKKTLDDSEISLEEKYALDCIDFTWWVPLVSGGALQGLLLITERSGGDFFTYEELRILTVVSQQSGIAAHNVRLMEQVRAGREELGIAHQQLLATNEREQKRLANELHDVIIQQLLGISYQLLENERLLSDGKDHSLLSLNEQPFAFPLAHIRQEILGTVTQLRGVIGTLRPAGLEELGLTHTLEGYIARLAREQEGQPPEFVVELAPVGSELSTELAITIFRIVQESVRNTLKHAQARCVTIRLISLEGGIKLLISDDGCGFWVPSRLSELTKNDHYGLVGMAERVSWADGKLDIHSVLGQGTEIRVFIPFKAVPDF
ncbi:MAG: ATP-binding protein [Chloroflexota bacterium]